MSDAVPAKKRRLIEDWLPIAELSIEASRERRIALAGSVLPPTTYLHVWFARRPLVASRAAILGSLLDSDADRASFLQTLGIHGDPVKAEQQRSAAGLRGESMSELRAFGYRRAFKHLPDPLDNDSVVLDPTAGGGSVPFESIRLGLNTIANDLNPVASLLLKATVELPLKYGSKLQHRYEELSGEFLRRATAHLAAVFPRECENVITVEGYLWARTVTCPYCGGVIPLSPNWKVGACQAL